MTRCLFSCCCTWWKEKSRREQHMFFKERNDMMFFCPDKGCILPSNHYHTLTNTRIINNKHTGDSSKHKHNTTYTQTAKALTNQLPLYSMFPFIIGGTTGTNIESIVNEIFRHHLCYFGSKIVVLKQKGMEERHWLPAEIVNDLQLSSADNLLLEQRIKLIGSQIHWGFNILGLSVPCGINRWVPFSLFHSPYSPL